MRVYLESYGCAQNQGEGSALARELAAHGHGRADDPADADVGVLVTCGVIGPTESRMLERYRTLRERLPRIIVTGCLVPLRSELFDGPGRDRTTLVPIREQAVIPSIVDGWQSGPATPRPAPVGASACRTEEIVLAQGCTSHCAYCFSRLARGPLRSVPLPEVVRQVRRAVHRGAVEVRLSSLDTSAWGVDLPGAPRLPELLEALRPLRGSFRVRVGMMSPQTLRPIAAGYLDRLGSTPAFRFVHLPVQSGSAPVLRAMRRGYSPEEFETLIDAARRRLPDVTIATDVIVGYPGETEDDHRATMELLERAGPEIVNVTRFSPRPLTPAARLAPVRPAVAKRRSRELTALRQRISRARLEAWIGYRGRAWTPEPGRGGTRLARLDNYLPVVLDASAPLGAELDVRVDGARAGYLIGHAQSPSTPTAGLIKGQPA